MQSGLAEAVCRLDGNLDLVPSPAATAETPGGDEDTLPTPSTGIGRLRGSARGARRPVEVRLMPDGARVARWTNRWWDILSRRTPVDPLGTPHTIEAARALAGLALGESRVRFERRVIAFTAPGHLTDPGDLARLLARAAPHVATLSGAP